MTDKADDTKDEAKPKDFAVILVQTDKGRVNERASTELAELLKAVKATGKAGSLQITFKVTPDKGSDGDRVVIAANVVSKKPAFDPRTSIFFVDDDGGLHRDDPKQHTLPFGQESNAR